jgi:hypothetical protein
LTASFASKAALTIPGIKRMLDCCARSKSDIMDLDGKDRDVPGSAAFISFVEGGAL